MIAVTRTETEAAPADVEALLAGLECQPGIWMGCDVEADGLFRRQSMACAMPALRFCLDGAQLTVTPIGAMGVALLDAIRRTAKFEEASGSLRASLASGGAVIEILRRFLGQLWPRSPELALYGAFSFDYFRLGESAPLPEDGRRRLVLYFPQRVLATSAAGARWIEFSLREDGSAIGATSPAGMAPVRAAGLAEDPKPGMHAACVARGIELLRRGELYSLVLSQTFRRHTRALCSEAFASLRRVNPYPAMFFCNLGDGEILFGASPDMQVRADAEIVESAPVCGTLRRGADPLEDASQAFALLESEKEAAALALCADSAAEDLAAVCEPGTLELVSRRRLHYFSTIIHTVDHLRGRRRADLDGFALLLAHAAPATVTGLPKRDAIRAISELEQDWRGWYAGAVARVGTDGSVEAYTVLRAARVAANVAEIRTGGNILVDSDPAKEEEETRLKAQTLFSVLENPASVSRPAAPARWHIGSVSENDPFRHRMVDALARAGGLVAGDGRISVLSEPPVDGNEPPDPLLAIGAGAMWLLCKHGAMTVAFAAPRFAREVTGHATSEGFLRELGAMRAGWYVSHGIRAGSLPVGWIEAAISSEGWVLAAQHRERKACVILFRPDSMLSLRNSLGIRSLRAGFAWLDPCGMFAATSRQEEK